MSREKFEEWLQPYWSRSTFTDDDGEEQYRDEWVQGAWMGWQAASKASEQQLAELAAENAGLKQAITTHSQSTHFCEVCGKDDPCSTDDVCHALSETPATDAYLAEVRAQGVEMFASHLGTNDSEASVCKMIALGADEFAAQLRQGAKS